MQRLIAKYGLAAHLALAVAAPLFLIPFFGGEVIAKVLLWLTLYVAAWVLMEPSIRSGERLHDARKRVVKAIVKDPLFWVLLSVVVLSGVEWVNSGIKLAYDAETSVWSLAKPQFPILPGSVTGHAELPFAGMVLLWVVLTACRQALGRSARMVFLFLASLLSGIAAIIVIFAASQGHAGSQAIMDVNLPTRSFVGAVFGIYFIAATVTLVFGVERKWLRAVSAHFLAIGGCAAGLVAFAPAYVVVAFLAGELVVAAYAFGFSMFFLKGGAEFKFFSIYLVSLGLTVLLVMAVLPESLVAAKLAAVTAWDFFPVGFDNTRRVLSEVAFRVWKEHLWIGSGLGSFSLDLRFFVVGREWAAIPHGTLVVPNAFWQLLAENGLVGAVKLAVPLVFLASAYVRRLVIEVRNRQLPHPACLVAPVVTGALIAISLFDCSLLRVDLLLALCVVFAVSANSFHKEKK